jgi:hypothetical protein
MSDAVQGLVLLTPHGDLVKLGSCKHTSICNHRYTLSPSADSSQGRGGRREGPRGELQARGALQGFRPGGCGEEASGHGAERPVDGGGGDGGGGGGDDEEVLLRAARMAFGRVGVIVEVALKTEAMYLVRQRQLLMPIAAFVAAASHPLQGLHREFRHVWAHFRIGGAEVRVVGLEEESTGEGDDERARGGRREGGSLGSEGEVKRQEGEEAGRAKAREWRPYDGKNWFPFEPPPPLACEEVVEEGAAGKGKRDSQRDAGECWVSMQYSFPLDSLAEIMSRLTAASGVASVEAESGPDRRGWRVEGEREAHGGRLGSGLEKQALGLSGKIVEVKFVGGGRHLARSMLVCGYDLC